MKVDLWEKKLLAFLHDPPCKPLDISGHELRREAFVKRAGFDLADLGQFTKTCDWTAAAADRFPFPKGIGAAFDGNKNPFRHPMGGSDLVFDKPLPSADFAEEIFQDIQSGFDTTAIPEDRKTWANFFLHWRRWPVEAARKDYRTAFLPADTRMPDHNVWVHNSVVSALQACVVESGELKPAFLLFQLGPVQDFIEQALSTRDLWSGSYLLSWLMAHAMKAVTDQVGPDSVIFPSLREQPIFDFLHKQDLYDKVMYKADSLWKRLEMGSNDYLTPSLPNRFLALVPAWQAEDLAKAAEQAVRAELSGLADVCWRWLDERQPMQADWQKRFKAQVRMFPQITWQTLPWSGDVNQASDQYLKMYNAPCKGVQNLADLRKLATKTIPEKERDKRYFIDEDVTKDLNNIGFAWSYYHAEVDRLMAARRNLRDFEQWQTDEKQAGAVKDFFSGREEVIGDEDWWKALPSNADPALRSLFRKPDRLGAMNLIKRVWHKAYLVEQKGMSDKAVRFDSASGIAAAKWRSDLIGKMKESSDVCDTVLSVFEVIRQHAARAGIHSAEGDDVMRWVENTDPECFYISAWEEAGSGVGNKEAFQDVIAALKRLYGKKEYGISPPPGYVAVLALDGDEMGKWMSGEKMPDFRGQLSAGAQGYFKEKAPADLKRPLSPSWHLQFSEALSNFALHVARPIVEKFNGQLIYAGGDDVLAMLSATEALECAEALRNAFRGQHVKELFEAMGSHGGVLKEFATKKDYADEHRVWMMPGPNTDVSVGLAIGHCHAPLQGLVRAARHAEKLAKGKYGRGTVAVALHKRSGEIVEWGTKWEKDKGGLLPYLQEFLRCSGDAFTGRFPYALTELVMPYLGNAGDEVATLCDVENFQWCEVLRLDLARVVERQMVPNGKKIAESYRDRLNEWISQYGNSAKAAKSFVGMFKVSAFLLRKEEDK